ncbi:MAG: glycosyltransferase [Candidatus Omnitrophota bacterium]
MRCYNFAKEVNKYGISTEVLSFSDKLGARDGENESSMSLKDKMWVNLLALKKLLQERDSIFYIQRFNYHAFAPYIAHLINKNRIILDLDDWEMRENPKYYFKFYPSSKAHYLTARIAKSSICCIAASSFLKEFLLSFNKHVYHIPSGVDTELFKPSAHALNTDKIIFSWIGTFHKKEYIENIKFALDCFKIIRKDYQFVYFEIAGDGIYKNNLVDMINQYNDSNISLKAWMDPEHMPDYLNNINIGLFPVVKKNKFNLAKSPTKLFEYMSMAKPTISSEFGQAEEIIRDNETGLLASGQTEFISCMRTLIENPELGTDMGKKARIEVENFYSLKILGKNLAGIIKSFAS